jgi:hypothetical protein
MNAFHKQDRTIARKLAAGFAALVASFTLVACSVATTATTTTATSSSTTLASSATAALADNVKSHAEDGDTDYDAADAATITLVDGASKSSSADGVTIDGGTITITAPGTYVLSGTLTNGQVVVNSDAEGKVRIVLDNASITNTAGSAVVITAADEAVVVLADGSTNSVTDGAGYDTSADDAPNAALFSMADLTIGGTGSLTVTGNTDDGIASKDGLVIKGGTVTVTAADDGLKSDNEADDTVGYVLVQGGTVEVSAGDDGVHAEGDFAIEGGSLTVTKSNEGLEGSTVTIAGGETSVTASDDGLNATQGSTDTGGQGGGMGDDGSLLTISGGTLTIDAGGDGLDSNGTISITGGTTTVAGPTNSGNGALDSNGGITVTGGTLLAGGSAGMAETPGSDSTRGWLAVSFTSVIPAGSTITVVKDGTVLATYTTTKETATLVVAADGITSGESYDIAVDGTTNATVTAGSALAGGMGGGGRRP